MTFPAIFSKNGAEMIKTEQFSYDPVGSMSLDHTYLNTGEGDTVLYSNNDDSRLETVIGNGPVLGNYEYDHLGQRVMKLETGYEVFVYDIFGNLIGRYGSDGTALQEWFYLGNQRLALIQPGGGGGGGFPGCDNLPPPPQGCGFFGMGEGVALNWAIIGIVPFLIWAGYKYRRRPKILICFLAAGGVIIGSVIAMEAKSQTEPTEAVYYYHNDHLGTPKVITDQNGSVVWQPVYEPFGEIHQHITTPTISSPFRFPGQYEDELTGLYYNHHRYYMPGLGRYNRADPIIYIMILNDIDLNANTIRIDVNDNYYTYSLNNPTMFVDLYGLKAKPDCTCKCGNWQRKGWERVFNVWCRCFWMCYTKEGVIWSGNFRDLPCRTNGVLIFTGQGDGLKRGNECACSQPGATQ